MVEVEQLEVSTGRFCLVQEGWPAGLSDLLGAYMARQRWYAGTGAPQEVRVLECGTLAELPGGARLLWAVVAALGSRPAGQEGAAGQEAAASSEGPASSERAASSKGPEGAAGLAGPAGDEGERYQLLLASRPSEEGSARVAGYDRALVGSFGGFTYYDATIDPEMALALLEAASGGSHHAKVARPLTAEQSNTSVVYDDRLILKIFRRLSATPNLDAEVTSALARAGFAHVARPMLRWQKGAVDLAFGQEYLAGGTDGWALALTSLRDLYMPEVVQSENVVDEDTTHPGLRGGDFAAEAARLGRVTAEMHLSMAGAFGTSRDWSEPWSSLLASVEADLKGLDAGLAEAAHPLFQRLHAVSDLGLALRPHGDYHLGQVMRTDAGWYVLDFEGEPNRPVEERLRPTSPMKDVAGMLRSFDYATRFGMAQLEAARRGEGGLQASNLEPLAEAWKQRNWTAFMNGYLCYEGIEQLLPPDRGDREAVRMAFELEKALYELSYERAFRPEWAEIPLNALRQLFTGTKRLEATDAQEDEP